MKNPDPSGLNGRLLNVFLAIFDTNSVSAAAEKVGLNQSTVSYNLDRLRDALGDPLFVKSGRGITPTERSIMLAPQIRAIASSIENLVIARDYDPRMDTVSFSFATNVNELLPFCKMLHQNIEQVVPGNQIRFLELGSRENIKAILDASVVDLVISVRMVNPPNSLNSESFYSSEQVCYHDPQIRGPVDTVEKYIEAGHAVLDFGGTAKSTVEIELDKLGLHRDIRLKVPNASVLSELIKGTNLIATMQQMLSTSTFSGFAYCDPPFSLPRVDFDLIWHRRMDNAPRGIWLRNIVRSTIVQMIEENRKTPE